MNQQLLRDNLEHIRDLLRRRYAAVRRRLSWRGTLKGAGVVTLALLCGTLAVFVTIDRQVVARLADRDSHAEGVVFGDSYWLASGARISRNALLKRLEARSYAQVPSSPQEIGQFSLSQDRLEIVTRPFRDARARLVPSLRAAYDLTSGEVKVVGDPKAHGFRLEPVVLGPIGDGTVRRSTFRKLNEIPEVLKNAILVIEDRRFYHHIGIDPLGIARAMVKNLLAGHVVEGGSTITQQLAKNLLLTPRKTLGRKLLEMLAAFSLELHLTKDEILERYLNEVYFSQEGSVAVHGVSQAAKTFFGKDLPKLSISEAALLAGMVQAPSAYSPKRNLQRSLQRRDVVLQAMREDGAINDAEYASAVQEKIEIIPSPPPKRVAPFFIATVEQAIAEALKSDDVAQERVSIFTSIDPELQRCAESAVENSLQKLNPRGADRSKKSKGGNSAVLQQALVAIEPHSGNVKAWVGGRDFRSSQFDHVVQAKRQIGSTIKPFLYLTALDGQLNAYKTATAASILGDEPTQVKGVSRASWQPQNYDRSFHGDVTLRYALEHSLNLPAVYVAQRVGIPALVTTLRKFGIADSIPSVPALALGALDTTLLRLTSGYGAIANGGRYVGANLFRSVIDSNNNLLLLGETRENRVADEGASFVLTDILRGVVDRGTAQVVRRLDFHGAAAGKTGTSDGGRDAWFVGFTPYLVAGVWSGYDDNRKTGLTGGSGAAPTWAEFMKCAASFNEDLEFIQPPNVQRLTIDSRCFGRPTKRTPSEFLMQEVFVKGSEPTHICPEDEYPSEANEEANNDEDSIVTDVSQERQATRARQQPPQGENQRRSGQHRGPPTDQSYPRRRSGSVFERTFEASKDFFEDLFR